MKNPLCIILGLWLIIFCTSGVQAQYVLNGNAVKESCNCYVLTPDRQTQSGSVWQATKINLNNPFDFIFEVYPGCRDFEGADGIVFILQPLSTSIGSSGEGLGFEGITPSIGISLDTYQNLVEPAMDHISIQANGIIKHGTDLAGPIAASATSDNIEDCKWHTFRIKWDPVSKTISTYFDGVFRLSAVVDMVSTIFNNDPMVYWGFSAATGGSFNVQKFCTALVPQSVTDLSNDAACLGTPVIFQDNSSSFTTIKNYHWDFGDGTTSTEKDPPPHVYAAPGIYQVKHSITGMDGCESEPFTKTVTIGDKPQISMSISDTCEGFSPGMNISTNLKVGTITDWKWELDGIMLENEPAIDLSKVNAGMHNIQLSVTSSAGCASAVVSDQFIIKNAPGIDFTIKDGCINESILFTGMQTDAVTTITNWKWDFGNNIFSEEEETSISYDVSKNYPVKLLATASNGCFASAEKNIFINEAKADAGRDTVVLPDTFFQLNGEGGDLYSWTPSTGLSNPQIANPTGSISDDIAYHLRVETVEGCVDTASVNVLVFKGSAVYVPNAFTPNYDGLNDVLQPYMIGIKTLNFFTIFDRWGNKVFSTNNFNAGWDGNWKGRNLEGGTYVWVLKAEDLIGKMYDLRGSFVLIK